MQVSRVAGESSQKTVRSNLSPASQSAIVFAIILVFFSWCFAKLLLSDGWLAHSDLWEYFLPAFLSPDMLWSPYESAGIPVFADPSSVIFYPLHFIFADLLKSWSMYIASAFVLVCFFTYLYLLKVTDCVVCAVGGAIIFALSHAVLGKIPHLTALHGFIWLPLILLSLEHVVERPRPIWISIGAFAVGLLALSGHTPHIVYILYATAGYALAALLVSRAGWKSWLAVASLFVLGLLLSAVQTWPVVEALDRLSRDHVAYTQFIRRTIVFSKFVVLSFFPVTFADNDYREAPAYVGMGALFLGALGLSMARQNWRVVFWAIAAIIAVLVALGDQAPVSRVVFQLPMLDKTRIISRLLFVYAFAIASLAAFGLLSIRRGTVGIRSVLVVAAAMLTICALSLVFAQTHLENFEGNWKLQDAAYLQAMLHNHTFASFYILQFIFILVTAALAAGYILNRFRQYITAILYSVVAVLALDLLVNSPWFGITPSGIPFAPIPHEAMDESVHVADLRSQLDKTHQRGGSLISAGNDALVFGVTSRLWRFPHFGAYSPLMLDNYHHLFLIENNGSVPPQSLTIDRRGLDLAAVKYVWLPHQDLTKSESLTTSGITVAATPLHQMVGYDDCKDRGTYRFRVYLPKPRLAKGAIFVGATRCGEDLPQGTPIGLLIVADRDGRTFEQPLRMGIETADRALGVESIKSRGGSQRPIEIFEEQPRDDGGALYSYTSRVEWPEPIEAEYVEFVMTQPNIALQLDDVTIVDSTGAQIPLDPLQTALADPRKWRFVKSIETSRVSDRREDVAAKGEVPIDIFENLRALPRAWVVPAVKVLKRREIDEAIRISTLPDGGVFVPEDVALLERAPRNLPAGGGRGTAKVLSVSPTRVVVQTRTDGSAYLVLSDVWYPGWEARIGRKKLKVLEADRALRLVAVPAGEATVVFEFRPRSLVVGASISAATLIALIVAPLLGAWRRRARERARRRKPGWEAEIL